MMLSGRNWFNFSTQKRLSYFQLGLAQLDPTDILFWLETACIYIGCIIQI